MIDKMREVPPITDETYKALMVALGMPNSRSLLSALQQVANHATQRAAWQAAQSEQSADLERLVMSPYLHNRGDGVDGHYCIGRRRKDGFHEFWNEQLQKMV